ncbi:hypothetical protein [Streptomyces solincola]|uniref:hypothetical protein n=1 Tax=Streptomyces solincola TaxID=2100817 RepID=UPI002158FCBB|nr:hypothetical protein [Streptomyces solincola]
MPLSPEQSAAVLRERCLGFLFGFPHLPIHLDGVIWQVNDELPVDKDYLAGVDQTWTGPGCTPWAGHPLLCGPTSTGNCPWRG